MVTFGRDTRIRFVGGEIIFHREGFDEMVANLDGIVRRSQHLGPVFQRFQPHWFEAIAEAFDKGGDPVEWPELSPAYEGWKSRAYPGQPIMRRSDELYESLTNQTSDTIWRVGPRSIEFGTRVPYFTYHQEGIGVPQRQTLTLPAEAASILNSMILSYVSIGKSE
jgi:phage gpG-like protein